MRPFPQQAQDARKRRHRPHANLLSRGKDWAWSRTLRTKLVLLFALLIGVISIFIVVYYPIWHQRLARRPLVAKADNIAEMTAAIVAADLAAGNADAIENTFRVPMQNPELIYIAVRDVQGQTIASFRRNLKPTESADAIYTSTRPIAFQDRPLGELRIGFSLASLEAGTGRIRERVVLLSLAVFLLGLGTVFAIATFLTRPLSHVTRVADHIAEGRLTHRAQVVNPRDEIGLLATAFNHMVDHLEELNHTLESRVDERTQELSQQTNERILAEEERTDLQDQLRQSQKMEAIGRLAGGVAHDFNNQLMIILGNASLAMNRLSASDPTYQELEAIHHAGESATALTRQLLAFSRKQVMQAEILDLNAIVTNVEKMLHRLIGEDVELVTQLQSDLGNVKADPGQIEQVLLNLAVNARDAMPHGGQLIIETAEVDLDATYAATHDMIEPGPYVMLACSDTGEGMTPETQAQIFEPFFTTKGRDQGTGLGLSTVYGIIKQSGGYIWVYSEEGKGTTIKVYLPRIFAVAAAVPPPQVPTPRTGGSETVLMVEDDPSLRRMVAKILEGGGYQVIEAQNAIEALELGQQDGIDLLLTDIVMPKINGPELVAALEKIRPDLKVLFMSGYTDNALLSHYVLDAGRHFIQKPFSTFALDQKIREILDS